MPKLWAMSRLISVILIATCLCHGRLFADERDNAPTMNGVTISCFRNGPGEWDSPMMAQAIRDVQSIGANWITFHPYARIYRDGSMRFSRSTDQPSVVKPLTDAKRLGVNVMLKPHIAYWGSGFDWRGDIVFRSEPEWRRFFADYTEWIVTQAKMAEAGGAAIFCVGLEYKKTEHREADWRAVIAAVRQVYSGKLTYAANWDTYHKVKFWDALDYIGVQAYFPVCDGPNPTETELHEGWDKLLVELEWYSKKIDKPMLFTELGYNHSDRAGERPWDYQQGGKNAAEVKLRCMRIALQRVRQAPFIKGVFLWKWFPSSRELSRNFCLQYSPMRQVISNAWQQDL